MKLEGGLGEIIPRFQRQQHIYREGQMTKFFIFIDFLLLKDPFLVSIWGKRKHFIAQIFTLLLRYLLCCPDIYLIDQIFTVLPRYSLY
jgi:hypothetical protein